MCAYTIIIHSMNIRLANAQAVQIHKELNSHVTVSGLHEMAGGVASPTLECATCREFKEAETWGTR